MADVTHILDAIEHGDPHAAEQLLPLVYDELRQLAAQKLAQEQPGQTLQATALVHEVYLRLVQGTQGEQGCSWDSRRHFFAAADEASACFRQAIALEPRHTAAHNALGVALSEKGQMDEAIACFKKAIELDPIDALAHVNLGNALKGKGHLDEAIACFRKALQFQPDLTAAKKALAAAQKAKGGQGSKP
jgi:tetratricopeptide (TPR) repeat protein